MLKRRILAALALVLAAVLAASCGARPETSAPPAAQAGSGKLFENPVTIDMWIWENATYVYQKDLMIEKAMNERLNVFYNITAFQEGLDERVNLGLASGDLPDVYFGVSVTSASDWGTRQGALVDLTKHFDKMPNYTAWAADMGDYPEYFYTADGAMYIVPNYGYGTASNSTFWVYRKDIFDKHGLSTPTTDDEFYDVCVALKNEYPDAYPLTLRSWLGIIDRIAYQWGTSHNMYYKNETQKWTYAQLEPEYRDCIEFLAKLYAEELIPPTILSLDTAGWQEILSTHRGFIFNDYQARIDFYNNPMRQDDPSVNFTYMPPFKGGANGTDKFNPQTQLIIDGQGAFTGSKIIPELIKYFDWQFTDEAKLLMSWGVEGVSYGINPDGSKFHIGMEPGKTVFFDLVNTYGLFQRGFYCLVDPPSHTASIASPEQIYAVSRVQVDSGEYRIPSISFTEENQEKYNILNVSIGTLSDENVGKFITGQRPMSEWDQFLNELDAIGIQDFIKLHNDQQDAINAAKK